MTAREVALKVLRRAMRGDAFVSELLDAELGSSALPPAERRLATELAYGCLRMKGTLDYVIERCAGRGIQAISSGLRDILRMGVYQLLYLDRVPPYAAVNEAVEFARGSGPRGSEKFVNAVLRRVARGPIELLPGDAPQAQRLAVAYSHPVWLVERWLARWEAADVEELCAADNSVPATTVRANALRCSREELLAALERDNVRAIPNGGHPLAVDIADIPVPLTELQAFRGGLFQVQDVSGMRIAGLVGARRGERVADLCAGPGGKATAIAEAMGDEGEVICLDLNGGKARMVRENAKRLGLASLRVVVGNARDAPALLGRRPIDRVLVDVPCSNTGVLRRRPEARWRLREDDIGRLARNGLALLSSAASVVRPGGTIVYSTCSIEPEENEHVVSLFLRTSAGFSLDKELKFLPHKDGCDGGYGAGLIRR